MPTKPPKKCTHYGCNILTHGRHCKKHAAEAAKAQSRWDKTNPQAAAARGYDGNWRKIRAKALRRDSGLCVSCLTLGLHTKATAVDHIIPKALGGTNNLSNLASICDRCHARKTGQDKRMIAKAHPKRRNGTKVT